MTDQQLHDIAQVNAYLFEELKAVHDSLPPERQNQRDIIKEYELSLQEALTAKHILSAIIRK